MSEPILDPVDYYHPNYFDFDDGEILDSYHSSIAESYSGQLATDEGNHFIKLGEFWPGPSHYPETV